MTNYLAKYYFFFVIKNDTWEYYIFSGFILEVY